MLVRYLVTIPVYNNPETILTVSESVLENSPYKLLLIDDGSDIPVSKLVEKLNTQFQSRITIIRHESNLGKGLALQSAINWSIQNNYTHLITIDGDGQHDPKDIPKLVAATEENPWALIVGERNMQTENVPKSSLFGRAFSNFWIEYETSKKIKDSQSGYRIYPLYFVQTMQFFGRKYDFEVEILTRLLWKKVEVINVPVSVVYFPPGKRVTHFHKFRDNFRITLMNIALVLLSLLEGHISPLKGGVAFGLGVMVGSTPLFGLHGLIVFILSFLFRLNFSFLFVGTQISLPPLVPFLVVGTKFIQDSLFQTANENFTTLTFEYFISSLILGLALGVSFGMVVALVLFLKQKKKSNSQNSNSSSDSNQTSNAETKTTQERISRLYKPGLGIRIMQKILKYFGLRFTYFCLNFIYPVYYLFDFKARRSLTEYWKILKPDLGFFQRQVEILKHLNSFSVSMVDRYYQNNLDQIVFKFSSNRPLEALFEDEPSIVQPKGIIFVNGHFGGWDLSATLFRKLKSDKKIQAVMFGQDKGNQSAQDANDNYQKVFFNQESFSLLKIKANLEKGQNVALMFDRPVSKNIELVPFFGKLAIFDSTPFKVAAMCKVKLCCIYSFKVDLENYKIVVLEMDPVNTTGMTPAQKEEALYLQLVKCVQGLESELKNHPHQWYNFFPFWSHQVIR